MKKSLLSISATLIFGILSAQQATEGTYMTLYTYYNYNLTESDGVIRIEPCQRFDHQGSIDRNTYEFKKIEEESGYGLGGSNQVPLTIESNGVKFQNPYNLNEPVPMMLVHPNGQTPSEGVLTYYDETQGGFSTARIRITDPARIKSEKCLIHSHKTDQFHDKIIGSFTDDYDSSMRMNLQSDFTGAYLGHPITWSVVSDFKGNVKKWDYPNGNFLIHIMMEFVDTYPSIVDPPSARHAVALIEGVRVGNETSVGRMNKN